MVGCINYDTMLDIGYFYADTKAELKDLPNLNSGGKEGLFNMNKVGVGSRCICYGDKQKYILTGNNTWAAYASTDEGGGGGGTTVVANPDGEASDNLHKLQVGNNIYQIPSGGGGDAALENDVTSNLAVGAIPAGTKLLEGTTFTEFVEKLLITEIAPTISFSISKSGNVVYGSSYTETLTVKATAMGTAKSIDTIEWYQGSTLLQTDTIGSTTTGTWTYTMSTATTSNTTFKAIVKYKKSNNTQTSYTGSSSISFYYNKFHGSVNTLTPDEATVTGLTAELGTAKGATYTITMSNARIAYAYPKSLGALSSIKDGNNFDITSSFTRTEQTYTQNSTSVAYYLYVLTDPTSVTNYKVIFA